MLQGKTILVTGATSGIGAATAEACAQEGARVVLSGRNAEAGEALCARLEGSGHCFLPADLGQRDEAQGLIGKAVKVAGRVDGLFLVISMGKTSRRLIQRAVESLTSIGFGVDGVVLNNMSTAESRYGDYYYAREYKHE